MTKTKNNFIYSSQNDKKTQYISRSTNKKISTEKNKKNKNNNNQKDNFKMSSTLMEMNRFQNQNNKYKKYTSDFFQNNSLYNLISKNHSNNFNYKNNIKVISIPKTKLLIQDNSGNNSSLIFNINEDQKNKNNNSVISSNKQNNSKQKMCEGDSRTNIKNSYKNKDINIQKYSIKKNCQQNYGKYINSNNNSKEENIIKNKNNFNCNINKNGFNDNELLIDSKNNNNYITYHKNKNNINNKYILQKILSNLFSSNKKKNNIKKDNNNNRENKFINDSFNNNKIANMKNINKNRIINEHTNIDKRRETPKLKSNNSNNKKISGLFSANHKDKDSNIITDIRNSKSKKANENLSKRNLSINIHSYNINECKFKTSINYEIFNKKPDKDIPKLNLNQVFNLKLYDKNKINNNNNYCNNNNNISIKNDKNIKDINNINSINNNNNNNNNNININSKNKILYFFNINNNLNNNNNNNNDNLINKPNNIHNSNNSNNSNTIHNYNIKKEQNSTNSTSVNVNIIKNNNNSNNNNNNKKTKFTPKNIYKEIRKSHLQRFFSYSKEKTNIKNNIIFMKNIKKINFNENKKSTSKNSTRRWIKSNDNKSQSINKPNNYNSSSKYKKEKEINDTYINLRKRRSKYADINKIIEINNLKCLKHINNSEINNLKKYNNNFNTNETINKNNERRNNHSASHNNLNNKQKYDINRIGNLFKPIIEKNIRGSYKEANRKKHNFEVISSVGKKNKNKNKINNHNNNYSNKKIKNQSNEYYKNIKINKYNGIYLSNKKENNYNNNNANNKLEMEEMVNYEIDENKTKENIIQNSLTMYSIYILSKYYDNCDKIGISKISIYDKNKNLIPIEYSNTNEGINVNHLFNINLQGNELNNFPLISLFKENFCINFYIKNINNSFLDYIYIYNFSDLNNGISPVKDIKIFKTTNLYYNLLYKGCLNENSLNVIKISNYINEEENKENIFASANDYESNEKYNIIKNNEKSLTFNIFKSLINVNMDNDNNFKINRFNSARNTFNTNRYSEDINNKNNNNNYNENNNISMNNNEIIENNENILFFQTNYGNNNQLLNSYKDLSKTNISHLNYYDNDFNLNNQNENETNFSKTMKLPNFSNKLFLNSYNSAFDDVDNLFRTSIGYKNKPEDSEINNNINENNNNNNNYDNNINVNDNNNYDNNINVNDNNYGNNINVNVNDNNYNNNLNINDYNNNNYFFDNNDIDKNYIEFNKINIFLKSNYGHRKYIGLTGIIFIDEKNEKLDIEKAQRIGALPKDLRTIYNDDSDNRIFENVFNGINNTNDPDNMWVTRLKKNDTTPYLELYFEEKIKLSKIIIYNYNQKDKLEIGTKSIDIFLDDYYYKTISLVQGTGEVANIKNDNNSNDFGQEICFNNEYENFETINKLCSTTGFTLYNKEENNEIKYASNLFEQCYETPYLPSGNFIKFQFISYYFDNNNEYEYEYNYNNIKENDFYLGINNIEIFNEDGINILNNNKDNKKLNYRSVSNREINRNNEEENNNYILIKGNYIETDDQNKYYDNENNLFYFFDKLIQISYIKITPISNDINNLYNNNVYKIKEIKIFCEDKIIFEGEIYKNKPTIILFTSENKLVKDINQNYLTKYINKRRVEEIQTNDYCSLILN